MTEQLSELLGIALFVMVILFILSRLILRFVKLKEKSKWDTYDKLSSTMIDLVLCTLFISLFAGMILDDKSAKMNGITVLMAMYSVIPYSLFVTITCGYKRLKIVWMTLLNIIICYGGFASVVWIA